MELAPPSEPQRGRDSSRLCRRAAGKEASQSRSREGPCLGALGEPLPQGPKPLPSSLRGLRPVALPNGWEPWQEVEPGPDMLTKKRPEAVLPDPDWQLFSDEFL